MSFLNADMKGIRAEDMAHIGKTACNGFTADVSETLAMPSLSFGFKETRSDGAVIEDGNCWLRDRAKNRFLL